MVDVYYPYFHREAVWEELRYSIRSLEKHLKEEFRLWIVGDLPEWLDLDAIYFMNHKRCEGMDQNTVFDAIQKLLLYLNHPNAAEQFIRMYDDIYLLDDVDLLEIGKFKAMYPYDKIPKRYEKWWGQLYRSVDAVRLKGYPGWNTETHLPELFYRDKMKWIIDTYKALERRLLTSTLYFNAFFAGQEPILFKDCRGIQFYNNQDNEYYTSSKGDLDEKCKGMLYLNHNNAGLNDNLKSFLQHRFPDKSRFEK
jgi:hypothetical protein